MAKLQGDFFQLPKSKRAAFRGRQEYHKLLPRESQVSNEVTPDNELISPQPQRFTWGLYAAHHPAGICYQSITELKS